MNMHSFKVYPIAITVVLKAFAWKPDLSQLAEHSTINHGIYSDTFALEFSGKRADDHSVYVLYMQILSMPVEARSYKDPSQLCGNVVNEDINIVPEMIADEYILLMGCVMCRHALLDFVTCVSLVVQ